MLSGEGDGNENVDLISKKTTLHLQHTFLYISLPLICTTTAWNVQKRPGCTFYGRTEVVICVPVNFFFFASAYFHLAGR